MSWTQDFQTARKSAKTLSDIEDFTGLVSLAEKVGQDLQADKVSSRQIRVLLSETTAGVSRIRRGRTLGLTQKPVQTENSDERTRTKHEAQEGQRQDQAARREAALLNISLIYNAGRDKSGTASIRSLTDLMGAMTSHVHTFEDFKVLRKFSEAVMAYFKFHGGK